MQASKILDGKKYMWDGAEYPDEAAAAAAAENHRSAGFETAMIPEGRAFYVFTRRVVTEIKLEGAPPA